MKRFFSLTNHRVGAAFLLAIALGLMAGAAAGQGGANLPAAPEATAAMEEQLVAAFQQDQGALIGYTHREHVVTGKDGKFDGRTLRVWYVHGRLVSETIALDDRTLSPQELAAEHKRALARAAEAAQRMPPQLGTIEFGGRSYPFAKLAHDYIYTKPHTIVWNGRPTWVYEVLPNPQAKARSREEKLLLHTRGEVYVDAGDQHVVRMAVHATRSVHYGLGILATIHQANFLLQLQRIAPGIWLPQETDFHVQATVLLFDSLTRSKRQTFYDYQPAQAESAAAAATAPAATAAGRALP